MEHRGEGDVASRRCSAPWIGASSGSGTRGLLLQRHRLTWTPRADRVMRDRLRPCQPYALGGLRGPYVDGIPAAGGEERQTDTEPPEASRERAREPLPLPSVLAVRSFRAAA